MVRKRGDSGQFIESVTHEAILEVFDHVEGPVITSADVAEILDCSSDVARNKLGELYEEGRLDRRKTAGRIIYWRPEDSDQPAINPDDEFWGLDPVETGDPTDASKVDEYLYGESESEPEPKTDADAESSEHQ